MTKLFEKILITTDGSPGNSSAVIEGLQIGRVCGSGIFVVYVIDTKALSSLSSEILVESSLTQMQAEAEHSVGTVMTQGEGLDITACILNGDPVNEIIRFASARSIDLIVVGTQGKHGIERLFLGSVAEGVIRQAPCPVLVVRSHEIS